MTAASRLAVGWIVVAAIVAVLAVSPALAGPRDREDWIAPPLQALGTAIGKLRRLVEPAVRPAAKPRRKADAGKARRSKSRQRSASPDLARPPRARPAAIWVERPPATAARAAGRTPPKNPPPAPRQSTLAGGAPPLPRPRLEPPAPAEPRNTPRVAPLAVAAAPTAAAGENAAPLSPALAPETVDADVATEGAARLPRRRPAPTELAALGPVGAGRPAPPAMAASEPIEPSADSGACLKRLTSLGAVFREIEPLDPGGECPVAAPLEVTSLGSGVALTPAATLNCRTAEALTLWVRDAVIPAARTHFAAVPVEIAQVSTYVCRPRGNVAGAKLSEHAAANAVDVGAIGFANRPPHGVETRVSDTPEGRFAAAIRAGSCRYFTTVLGPGSDAAHAMHFHFDMAQRPGGYRICELGEADAVGSRD